MLNRISSFITVKESIWVYLSVRSCSFLDFLRLAEANCYFCFPGWRFCNFPKYSIFLNNFMLHDLQCKTGIYSSGREVPQLLWNRKVSNTFKKLVLACLVESSSQSHTISLDSFIILLPYLSINPASVSSLQLFLPHSVCIYHLTGDRYISYVGRSPLSHYTETYLLKLSAYYEPPFFLFVSHSGYKYSIVGVVILHGYSPLRTKE